MSTLLMGVGSPIFSKESLRSYHQGAAVGIWGVGRVDRANLLEAAAFEFAGVNISVLGSSYSRASKSRGTANRSRPCAVTSTRSDELNGVSGLDLKDLFPANQVSTDGVRNNHVFGVELNLGSEESGIASTANCEGEKKTDYFSSTTFISHGVISEKKSPGNANGTQEPGVSRSESDLLHSVILSYEQLLQDRFAS